MKSLKAFIASLTWMGNAIWELTSDGKWNMWTMDMHDNVKIEKDTYAPRQVRDCAEVHGVSFVLQEDHRFRMGEVFPCEDDREQHREQEDGERRLEKARRRLDCTTDQEYHALEELERKHRTLLERIKSGRYNGGGKVTLGESALGSMVDSAMDHLEAVLAFHHRKLP